jgi:hypothetical protein
MVFFFKRVYVHYYTYVLAAIDENESCASVATWIQECAGIHHLQASYSEGRSGKFDLPHPSLSWSMYWG